MAQAHTAALETAWAATSRQMHPHVWVQWDGANWVDETAHVESVDMTASLYDSGRGLPFLGTVGPASATLLLRNEDNRFSPDNASSPLHAYIADGIFRVPVRIDLSYIADPPENALRQFTGEIEQPTEWEQAGGKFVQFACVDCAEPILQDKRSTTLYQGQRADQLISTLLTLGGIAGATLDSGMSIVPYAWLDDENLWGECQAIAAADGGSFYFDKAGTARFERMTHWLEGSDHTSSQATLGRGNAFWRSAAQSWRDCYTAVIVERAPRYLGAIADIYSALDAIEVPPAGSTDEVCRFRYPVHTLLTPEEGTDYKAVSAGMSDMASSLTIVVTAYCQRADVEFSNSSANHALYVLNFKLRGVPLMGDEAQETREESSLGKVPGTKEFPVRSNPYLQSEVQAGRLAGFLRDRLQRPRRLLGWRGPACPWLEMGDRVTVVDADAGVNLEGYVLSIRQGYRAGGHWQQELTVLPAADLFPYLTYFVLGTSNWADPSDRLFY